MPYSGGLNRNIVQCLDDYGIPLYLSHTVTNISGRKRVESVTVSKVDASMRPIPGTEMEFECDTLLLSVGLIPENELSRDAGIEIEEKTNGLIVYDNMETSVPGIFAAGNVVHVHDLADFVSAESAKAGACAAGYVAGSVSHGKTLEVEKGFGIGSCVPQKVHGGYGKPVELFLRVNKVFRDCVIRIDAGSETVARLRRKVLVPGEMERVVIDGGKLADIAPTMLKLMGLVVPKEMTGTPLV
jgi:NADPH-dependent 2,4-dienoyl-CoA reductase/sulfur reductase-like enzyme